MSLVTSNQIRTTDDAVRCAKFFAGEVLETIGDMETLGTLLDTMEFFHSISSSQQFFTILKILHEALDIPMPDILDYFQDNHLSDLFFSCFMSEVVVEVLNGLGGDDI